MGWLDNLWRRRQGRTTETPRDTADARAEDAERRKAEKSEADLLEERAHLHRDEEILREPRKPPGTG
jgi:hypothetical protein